MDTVLDQKLVSSWFDVHQSVPQTYVFPPEKRPGKLKVSLCKSIPVVDLGSHDRRDTIQQIFKASQDFGFFQVINHGVSNKLIDDTMSVFKEFHAMPPKDKANEYSKDPSRDCKLYTSSENYANEVHFWRDALTHPGHTSEKYLQYWPQKPTQYREIVKRYLEEVSNMGAVILELLAEGLTLGLTKHRDPTLITILLQDTEGLQVFKDGNWIGIEPVSSAFVVNIGYVLQIISNSKLKGAEHRVVTNSRVARTTIAYLIYPSNDNFIEPAKALCNRNPPLYRSMTFKEFLKNFKSKVGHSESVLQTISVSSSQCCNRDSL
ncbi:hypothetical protein ACLB2K_019687 [Fragaria x ananassa]